jgi:hypothetical protein
MYVTPMEGDKLTEEGELAGRGLEVARGIGLEWGLWLSLDSGIWFTF